MRAFFEQWYPRLVRFLYARLGDLDQAEDVAQEAFLRLLQQRPRDPGAWIFTVARNLATDERRVAGGRARLLSLVRAGQAEAPATDGPDLDLLRHEELERVRAALAGLPDRDRTLLLLRHEDLSYREIAEQVEVAPSSIGSLLTRAQRRFLASYRSLEERDARRASG